MKRNLDLSKLSERKKKLSEDEMAKLKGMKDQCDDACYSECEIITLGDLMSDVHFHSECRCGSLWTIFGMIF